MIVLTAPIKFQGQIGQLINGKEAWTIGNIDFEYLKQNMLPDQRGQLEGYDFQKDNIRIEVIGSILCAVAIGTKKK